jgi:hypothetical protein
MIWMIPIAILVLLLLWILLVPVIVFLDTDRNRYHITLPGIFRAVALPADGMFRIRIWVFFIPFTFNPFRSNPEKKQKERKKKKPTAGRRLKGSLGKGKLAIRALRAITIRKLELDIDTDDFILNAWLIPVFSAVNSGNIRMRANFEGQASLLFDLRVHLGQMLWIMITNKIRSFY